MDNDLWCHVLVMRPDGTVMAAHDIAGAGVPDLGAVNQVARFALLAGRLGGYVILSDVVPVLSALLELSGLCVQMERQAETRKETIRIQGGQEELHSRNHSR